MNIPTLMKRRWTQWCVTAMALGAGTAWAGDDKSAAPADPATAAPPAAAKPEEKKPDFPPFEEVSKDHKKLAGPQGEDTFFPIYHNEKTDQLLAVIPQAMMGKNFLLASSIAGGPQFTGFMWGDLVVQWQRRDKKLVLVEPDLRYKPGEKSTVEDVIRRTYTERILLATPIMSELNGDPVISLDGIFKSNFQDIGSILGGNVDPSISRWAKHKGFPNNVEIAVDLALMDMQQMGGQRARVHYSLSKLPENDYQPRQADERVGYFMTAVKDWARPHSDKTIFQRYVHRWQLRKENPEAEISDVKPEDQIIFYIEKTVPKELRVHVRDGILEWNKSFEKCGLRNAVAVRQQTDTVFSDVDPEDVRYNFFRWIVSGSAFAMGPSRVNPLTGQILDADIVFDDSFVRSLLLQYARLSSKGPTANYDPPLTEFLARYPQWGYLPMEERLTPGLAKYSGVASAWTPDQISRLTSLGLNPAFCSYAEGMAHEMAFGASILSATGDPAAREKFIGQLLKEIVAHEVGHTLGLRHNFKASSWLSLEQILNTKDGSPTCGSVMDYIPALYTLKSEDQGNFITTTVGPYDDWAIEYGYRPAGGELKTDEDVLKKVLSRVAEPGLAYATDEDTMFFSPDPFVNRYDHGQDPVAYAKHRLEMIESLRKDMADWAVEDGESYNRLRKTFDMFLFETQRVCQFVARTVSGVSVSRDYKGDPNGRTPFEVVPAEKQQAALAFLADTLFSDKLFSFEPELLNKLAAGRHEHWDSDQFDSMVEYPLHDRIAATQYWSLFTLFNPYSLTRLYDSELKVPKGQEVMTVSDLLTKTTAGIWSELSQPAGADKWTDRKPFISSIRRSLQREHLNIMLNVLLSEPGAMMPADVNSLSRMTLKGLSAQIGKVLEGGASLDAFTQAHLFDSKMRIDKALEAEFTLNG